MVNDRKILCKGGRGQGTDIRVRSIGSWSLLKPDATTLNSSLSSRMRTLLTKGGPSPTRFTRDVYIHDLGRIEIRGDAVLSCLKLFFREGGVNDTRGRGCTCLRGTVCRRRSSTPLPLGRSVLTEGITGGMEKVVTVQFSSTTPPSGPKTETLSRKDSRLPPI